MPEREQREFEIEHDCEDPQWIVWGENQVIITCKDCGEDFYGPEVLTDEQYEEVLRG